MDNKRVRVIVNGRVQGVGFRAYVQAMAAKIGVSGWVRNVGDHQVEAVAEGTSDQIDRFIAIMQTGPRAARVDECNVEQEIAAGELKSFNVRYG
jgi:acylphosphatase